MFVKQNNTDDYLVAGRGMHPALAALSAVSTWNSGYMFIGFIGFTCDGSMSSGWELYPLLVKLCMGLVVQIHPKEGHERGVRSLSSLVAEGRCT